ncbi:MAG: 3-phosphoshikimate 1-carboxyvinyltransferase, partial [Paludibacteraceae bacterium]|nr:3-phosphoshikimate 1-carboxyvinyltransferase [Paludibacteraceae bacterium]
MIVDLPINKSLANRILIRQALCGDRLLPISVSMPQDVQIMHQALQDIEQNKPEIDVDNCGTAMRFLTAYLAQYEG